MHHDVIDGPYVISVNAHPEQSRIKPGTVDGYRVSVSIRRYDGAAVVKDLSQFEIPQGGLYLNLESALDDGERMGRLAIACGFCK
jgi:hypothetical protein